VKPSFTIHSPENKTYEDQNTLMLKVSGSDTTSGINEWKVNGNTFTPNATSNPLTSGQYTFPILAIDGAGNIRNKTISFTVELSLPDGYVTTVPSGKAVGLRSNPSMDLTEQSNSVEGKQDVLFGNSQGSDLAAQLRINMSAENVSADNLVFDSDRGKKKSFVHNTSSVSNIFEKTLLIPRVDDTGKVHICPGAESFNDTELGCTNGFNISTGQTANGVTVSEVTINGEDYYEATGISGTGGVEVGSTSSSGGGGGGSTGGSGGSNTVSGPFKWSVDALGTGFLDAAKIDAKPNESFSQEIKVENTGENAAPFEVSCTASNQCSWIDIGNKSFTVEPGSSKIVTVSGTVPGQLEERQFQAVISFTDPSYSSDTESSAGMKQVTLEFDTTRGLLSGFWNWLTELFSF
jgi:hypothetical protein